MSSLIKDFVFTKIAKTAILWIEYELNRDLKAPSKVTLCKASYENVINNFIHWLLVTEEGREIINKIYEYHNVKTKVDKLLLELESNL